MALAYPNPNSAGIWQLEVGDNLPGAQYEIFDAVGKLVLKSEIHNSKSEIELSAAQPGVYLLRITAPARSVIKKLVRL